MNIPASSPIPRSEWFREIPEKIAFAPSQKGPYRFRYYDPNRRVEGKPMAEHLRFAAAYWHTMANAGADPFGEGTAIRPWDQGVQGMELALRRVDAFFEILQRLGIRFYCFHCLDMVPYGDSLKEFHKNLDHMVPILKQKQKDTGIALGWGTANLFSHPKYVHGSLNANDPTVFAHAAACVKKMLEVTLELGGENFVFWGGRVGYQSAWNSDMGKEMKTIAKFYELAAHWADKIGFRGQFLIEPKAREPKSFQYDFSVMEALGFLRGIGLADRFKFNIETDHANLAGRTMFHELLVAGLNGKLGGIDANEFTPNVLWDTDCFPSSRQLATEILYAVLRSGGLGNGVINFDAKVRRESFEVADLFKAHILGMDTMAFGLLAAAELRRRGELEKLIAEHYSGWDGEIGQRILQGEADFEVLAQHAYAVPANNQSGRFEQVMGLLQEAMDAVVIGNTTTL